jgi:seryl-tRNA synthetase
MNLVRKKPELIKEMLRRRYVEYPLDNLLDLDKKRRKLISDVQKLENKRNLVSREIAEIKNRKNDAEQKISDMKAISKRISLLKVKIRHHENKLNVLLKDLPNIPHETVPDGEEEENNVELRKWNSPKKFEFQPKNHIDLTLNLDLIDIERATKVAGSRFYFLKGELVQLNYALIRFSLDFLSERGWNLIQPPFLLNRDAIAGSIILSDFEDVIYKVENEDLYLIGTSEHAIASMHMKEVLQIKDLPMRYAGVSSCFRKETGSHGRDTKGIFRVHQFEKIEQFVFSRPEDSWTEFEIMIKNAEDFFKTLELPFRVVNLCAGELGKVSAKTYDLEVWFPSQGKYREVVSCSNCCEYQARRLRVKFREKPHESSKFVHTLNSTLVATERAIIAIIENHQNRDGSISIPKALQSYMNGIRVINKSKK